jgi:hypothetical protein
MRRAHFEQNEIEEKGIEDAPISADLRGAGISLPGFGVSPNIPLFPLLPLEAAKKGCRDLPAGVWGVPKIPLFFPPATEGGENKGCRVPLLKSAHVRLIAYAGLAISHA